MMQCYFIENCRTEPNSVWPWERASVFERANLFVPDSIGRLLVDWKKIATTYNAQAELECATQSGILADWLEDRRDGCIALGSDPVMLDRFIAHLRDRFNANARPGVAESGVNES